jgi:ketosteroid isomerase-like protein
MKKLILTALIVPLFFSCTTPNNDKANIELIERYVQAVQDVDIEAMEAILDDDYVGLGPSMNDSIGKEMVLANWENLGNNHYESVIYTKSRMSTLDITYGDNQGEWVSNWAVMSAVFKDDHKSVTIWANSVYQIINNKIVKSYTFYNEADALEQLGFIFTHPGN